MGTFNCKKSACGKPVTYKEQDIPIDALTYKVICPHCNQQYEFKIKVKPPPAPLLPPPVTPLEDEKTETGDVGQLIVQSEPVQIFNLVVGKNVVGRANKSPDQPDIAIPTAEMLMNWQQRADMLMSRRHCVIEVLMAANGRFKYHLYDVGRIDETPSDNGTYLNQTRLTAHPDKAGKMEYTIARLSEGDVVQIGKTKFILKPPKADGGTPKLGRSGTVVM